DRGMSLTELVVGVAILAMLVAIAVPVYLNILDHAKATSIQTTLQNFRSIYEYEVVKGQSTDLALAEALNLNNNEVVLQGSISCVEANFADGSNVWHITLTQNIETDPSPGTIAAGACGATGFVGKLNALG